MKVLLVFGLYLQLLFATHLDNFDFEKLTYGPKHEIISHFGFIDKISFAKTSKEYLKHDPREVVLNVPLRNSKEPSKFLCEQLKTRKVMVIQLKEQYNNGIIPELPNFEPDSIEMKYLNCLTGIESLKIGHENINSLEFHFYSSQEAKIIQNPNFKIKELFPGLQSLQFKLELDAPLAAIPDTLKSLKIIYIKDDDDDDDDDDEPNEEKKDEKLLQMGKALKEKIVQMKYLEVLTLRIGVLTVDSPSLFSPMASELHLMPKFKRLTIEYQGNLNGIRDILIQIKHAHYLINISGAFYGDFTIGEFIDYLPKTIEKLNANFHHLDETEKFCSTLKTLTHLKYLSLAPREITGNFGCFLQSLPPLLTDLFFDASLKNNDISQIHLPKSLVSVYFGDVKSTVFVHLANHIRDLSTKMSDPENLLAITEPFTRVKSLFIYDTSMHVDVWIHLLKLLPLYMEKFIIYAEFQNMNNLDKIEETILSLKKRIQHINLNVEVPAPLEQDDEPIVNHIKRKYIFDGKKMTREE